MTTTRLRGTLPEQALVLAVLGLCVTGFWAIYVGPRAAPDGFHHLHVVTTVAWLFLLLWQLRLVRRADFAAHRRAGLAVLLMAPLLFATTAMLSVHSAHKGVVSGEGDFLIIQNVGVALQLALLILLAFVFRKRRALHGALLMSTAILFMGIALFFSLITFVPAFEIRGPETFYRFGTAAMTGQAICLVIGLAFVIRDWRNGWPYLLAALFFGVNEVVRATLKARDLIDPLTEFVGAMNPALTFIVSFVVLGALLAATGILRTPLPEPRPA